MSLEEGNDNAASSSPADDTNTKKIDSVESSAAAAPAAAASKEHNSSSKTSLDEVDIDAFIDEDEKDDTALNGMEAAAVAEEKESKDVHNNNNNNDNTLTNGSAAADAQTLDENNTATTTGEGQEEEEGEQFRIVVDEAQKKIFEQEREEIMATVPEALKKRFGSITFGTFGSYIGPALILNPYNIGPGPVRDQWFKMYAKCKSTGRLANMSNLIYWYGAYDNPDGAYSFLPSNKLVDFDTGKKRVEKKVEALFKKSRISSSDELLQKGMFEMDEDLKVEPSVRSGNIGRDFLEVYEHKISLGQEYIPEPTTPLHSPAPIQKKKAAKRKLADADGATGDEVVKKKKSAKAGKKPGRKKKSEDDTAEPKKKKKEHTIAPVSNDAEGDKPISGAIITDSNAVDGGKQKQEEGAATTPRLSAYDEYMMALAEDGSVGDADDDDVEVEAAGSGSDDDAADERYIVYTDAISKKPKKIKQKDSSDRARKERPKKKTAATKIKMEKRPKGEKKVPSQERKRREQLRLFEKCEKDHGHLIRRWKKAIENKDGDQIRRIYSQLLDAVAQFTAPFIEFFKLSTLMKDSKKIVNDPKRKELLGKLREQYEKKKSDVPDGFSVERTLEDQTHGSSLSSHKNRTTTPLPDQEASTNGPSVSDSQIRATTAGGMHRSGSQSQGFDGDAPSTTSLSQQPSYKLKQQVLSNKVDKKKKFSLGRLMRPASSTPQPEESSAKVSTATTSKETAAVPDASPPVKMLPLWVSQEEADDETVETSDEKRLLALEFLEQAVSHVPEGKGIDCTAISRNLEVAVHKWSLVETSRMPVNGKGKIGGHSNGAAVRGEDARLEKYWNKLHALVAGISGKHHVGTLASMIAQGRFDTADDVVKLSEDQLFQSFLGNPAKSI